MPSAFRYFVTVRRAIERPYSLFRRSATSSSESGLLLSSSSMILRTRSLTLCLDSTPPSSFSVPPVKKNLSGTIPCGVCAYYSLIARLTVETWIPNSSATSCIFSGLR